MKLFLRHAGVWTVEEATRMCRDKMIRLRSLYIAQFKRLQHVLKERKRKYCQAIQAEEEEDTGIGTYKGWCLLLLLRIRSVHLVMVREKRVL